MAPTIAKVTAISCLLGTLLGRYHDAIVWEGPGSDAMCLCASKVFQREPQPSLLLLQNCQNVFM